MTVRFGSFTLLADARRLVSNGRDLHLTPKAYDLLCVLVDAAPRVVAKAELHTRLWPDTFVSDATLIGLVKEVRRVLGDTSSEDPVIRTVARVGYALAIPVDSGDLRPMTPLRLVGDGQSFSLPAGVTVVGREPGCGVRLDTPGVSRRHATIAVVGDEATIADAGSKNGTTLNGDAVTGPVRLRDGDIVTFSSVRFVYRQSTIADSTETIPARDIARPPERA